MDAPREPSGSGLIPESIPRRRTSSASSSRPMSAHPSTSNRVPSAGSHRGSTPAQPSEQAPLAEEPVSQPLQEAVTKQAVDAIAEAVPAGPAAHAHAGLEGGMEPPTRPTTGASEKRHQGSGTSTPRGEDDPQFSPATLSDGAAEVQQQQQLQPPSTTASTLLGSGSTRPGSSQSVLRPVSRADSAGNAYDAAPASSPQISSNTQSRNNSRGMAGSSLSGLGVQQSAVTARFISDGLRVSWQRRGVGS